METIEDLHAASGDEDDLREACDMIEKVRKAETNGEALFAVVSYRKAIREKLLAEPQPDSRGQAREGWKRAIDWLRNNYQDHRTIGDLCAAMLAASPFALASSAAAEPQKPLFASSVARRKWEVLQAQGHRMQRLYFEREDGRSGHINPWGVVTWSDAASPTHDEQRAQAAQEGE